MTEKSHGEIDREYVIFVASKFGLLSLFLLIMHLKATNRTVRISLSFGSCSINNVPRNLYGLDDHYSATVGDAESLSFSKSFLFFHHLPHFFVSMYHQTTSLYFRGQRIWKAIILDLLPKGLNSARKALLSGCSAGGLATFLHCDNFASFLPENAHVKCLSDAGFFLDICDIAGNSTMRSFYDSLVTVQGVLQNLNENCSSSHYFPSQCFFPQYALPYIQTPYFILNSAYDVFQFHHALVPPSADPHGHWRHCSLNPAACTPYQIAILQGLRYHMLIALRKFELLGVGGMFINSCFAHCQSESQDTWLAPNSPRVHNKTIAQAVGDWYFGRNITKEIDCPYPCDKTCHNLIP